MTLWMKFALWAAIIVGGMWLWVVWCRRPAAQWWHVIGFGAVAGALAATVCLAPHIEPRPWLGVALIDGAVTGAAYFWIDRPRWSREPVKRPKAKSR